MMSPLTFTRTCSITSARVPIPDAITAAAVTTKSNFFIVFNILAYPNTLAQVAEQPGYAAEHAPFGPRVFLFGPEDRLLREAGGHLAGGRPGRPPRPLRLRTALSGDPHVEL